MELSNLRRNIKIQTYPLLALILNKLGFDWKWIAKKLGHETVLAQIKFLINTPSDVEDTVEKRLNIFLFAYLGVFTTNNVLQILIGKSLQRRGHKITVLLADRELPLCETTDIHRHKSRKNICQYYMRFNEKLFKDAGFNIVRLSELITDDKWLELYDKSNDDKWDHYVESMLLRYLKVGNLDLNDSLTKNLHKRARHAAFISEEVGKSIVKLNPDRVAFAHGSYTSRGPAKDVINDSGIPSFSVSRGKMAESQKLNWKTPGDWWDVTEEWEKIKDTPLDEKETTIIDDYLESRSNHNRDIIVYNHSAVETKDETIMKLGLNPEKRIYTLFTNVLWDAASAKREIAFENPLEWVEDTIKYFSTHKSHQLVVRIHPAESIIGTNQPLRKFIVNLFPQLPDNIKVIDPAANVNSWSLLKITDIGLVHTSTVGLELALEGIPCICLSKTHFRNKGFTIDVTSKEEYFRLLKNGVDCDKQELIRLAKRYSYLLFPRYQLPLPFLEPKSHIAIKVLTELDMNIIASHTSMKRIIKSIEGKDDFLLSTKEVKKMYL